MMKNMKIWAAIMACIIAALLLPGCTGKAESAAGSTATVQRGNLNINILARGNLKTAREENLAFYSAGTVQEVLVKIGDAVESGKALAILDTATLESALADAQINVKQARLDLESAKDVSTNAAGEATGAPNPLKIEKQEQVLKKAKDNLTEAEKKLQKATIIAPFAGLVSEVNVVPGDQVSASTVAVRLIDPINFQTAVLVNEMQVYQLKIGTPATVEVVAVSDVTFPAMVKLISETPTVSSNVVNYTVTVALDPVDASAVQALSTGQAPPGTTSARARPSGAVGQTSNTQASSDNRTFARQAFTGQQSGNQTTSDNLTSTRRPFAGQAPGAGGQTPQVQATTTLPQDFRLREGLTVTVSIIAEQRINILLVPNKAITSRGGRYYIQLVSAGKTEEKMIQAGITDGQNTEVVSGLSEGDVVSTATNVATPASTTNSQQQRVQTPSIPGVRLPGSR
ncbi:MAG: HlyD family efflux transporter periplasmic adaptor subunit [Dehalococcoidia bacterium]|nr:MAG: HlyD family efflux transporter periplasmic adaptor subunit [Dehalococcoidia bacterium]